MKTFDEIYAIATTALHDKFPEKFSDPNRVWKAGLALGVGVAMQEMQAEIDALKVAQTWQPIESAPMDARLVLLGVANGSEWAGVHTAHWSASKHAWMYSPDYAVPNPTHWMPLPPAPETAK